MLSKIKDWGVKIIGTTCVQDINEEEDTID